MRKLSLVLSLALLPFATLPALADGVTITVTPWLAPNAFGSPSYAQAVSNQEYAISHNLTTYGSAGPTQYNAQTNPLFASQSIVTGFNSWMGVAQPGGVYANELGNRMLFGIKIVGNGSQFSISQLSFSASSSDTGDTLGFSFDQGHYTYSSEYEGVLKGTDGVLGTSDDIYITSGANTQLVDALYGRGSGSSYAAYCDSCTKAQQQQAITDAAAYPGYAYSFTGTYMLGNNTGSGTFNVLPDAAATTPEPSSLMLLGTGVLGMAGAVRRRFLSNSPR